MFASSTNRTICAVTLIALLCSIQSCGYATIGAAASVDDSGGTANAASSLTNFTLEELRSSPASIGFILADNEGDSARVAFKYRLMTDGAEWEMSHLTLVRPDGSEIALTGNSITLPTSPGGVNHSFRWDFHLEAGLGGDELVQVQVSALVLGGVTTAEFGANAEGYGLGNDPPTIEQGIAMWTGGQAAGDIDIEFSVSDSSADRVELEVEYQRADTSDDSIWMLADPVAPLGSLESNADGVEHQFVWDSVKNLDGVDAPVRVRLRAKDGIGENERWGASGEWFQIDEFPVDNNLPPIALLDSDSIFQSPDRLRGVPLPLDIVDAEGDPSRIAIQWRRPGETYPTLPATSPSELDDLLADPSERARYHLCTEQPTAYEGYIAALPGALDPQTQLRLPELAGEASALVSLGLAGQAIEIMRGSTTLEPVNWDLSLDVIRDAVPIGDGRRAMILGKSLGSWIVQDRELATGNVLDSLDLSTLLAFADQDPVALDLDPGARFLFVATTRDIDFGGDVTLLELYRIDLENPLQFRTHTYIQELGTKVHGLAAPSAGTALVTTSNSSFAVRYLEAQIITQINFPTGLDGAWGAVADRANSNRVYVAVERTEFEGVVAVDFSTLETREIPAEAGPDLGAVALPSPRSVALDPRGDRLLVVTEGQNGTASIRALNARRQFDLTPGLGDDADPLVVELMTGIPDINAKVSAGPEGLILLTLPTLGQLLVAGGLEQIGTIAGPPESETDPEPYDPTRQVVTLLEALPSPPRSGSQWRIRAKQQQAPSSPEGARSTFIWDGKDVPQGGTILLRALAIDNDLGAFAPFEAARELRSPLATEPILLGSAAGQEGLPHACIAADLDGDGDLDIAATLPDRVLAFEQTSPGVFDPVPNPIATGPAMRPIALAHGDLNGDGLIDIAIANSATNAVDVYWQSASTIFEYGTSLTPAGSIALSDVAINNFDTDGRLDVIVLDSGAEVVTVFKQGDAGSFTTLLSPTGNLEAPFARSLAVYPVNDDDAYPDLVTTDSSLPGIRIYEQNGLGSIVAVQELVIPPLGFPREIIAANLRRDNLTEILIASSTDDRILVLQQDPGEGFEGRYEVLGGPGITSSPEALSVADLNGDGNLDIAAANGIGDNLTVFFTGASGEIDPIPLALGDTSSTNGPGSLIAEDLNGDGLVDLLCANRFGSLLSLFLQDTAGTLDSFPDQLIVQGNQGVGADPVALASGDLDGDGSLDVVCANANAGSLNLFLQVQPGILSPTPIVLSSEPGDELRTVEAIDIDGDGRTDILTGNSSSKSVELYLRADRFGFGATSKPIVRLGDPGFAESGSFTVADFDGDGRFDVATAGEPTQIFLQPAGGFGAEPNPAPDFQVSTESRLVFARDLDSDGHLDLITSGDDVTVRFGPSDSGSWDGEFQLSPKGSRPPSSIAAADLDGDGLLEIILSDRETDRILIHDQLAPRTFDARVNELGGPGIISGPQTVITADLERDGLPELLVANSEGSNLAVFFQALPGTFVPLPFLRGGAATTDGVHDVLVIDLDGDGDMDVVTVNPGQMGGAVSDTLTVLWGGH